MQASVQRTAGMTRSNNFPEHHITLSLVFSERDRVGAQQSDVHLHAHQLRVGGVVVEAAAPRRPHRHVPRAVRRPARPPRQHLRDDGGATRLPSRREHRQR